MPRRGAPTRRPTFSKPFPSWRKCALSLNLPSWGVKSGDGYRENVSGKFVQVLYLTRANQDLEDNIRMDEDAVEDDPISC
jgi:hypothetical protein